MTAGGTPIEMPAQRGSATPRDRPQHTEVLRGEPGAMGLDEACPVLANDIGHLEGWPLHRFCNLRDSLMLSGLETPSVSRGLATAVKCLRERCR